jgi:uncharacterized protein (TIGR04255 family)
MTANEVKYENLAVPPAMEAIFEVTIKDTHGDDVSKLLINNDDFKKRFPIQEDMYSFESIFDASGVEAPSSSSKKFGYTYKAADNKELTQFRNNGFSYNKLGDYPGGDQFIESALYAWKLYAASGIKIEPSRLGLRYINVISVPGYSGNPQEYFNVFLHHTDKIGKIEKYQYRYAIDFTDCGCSGIVNFQPAGAVEASEAKFILDIDIIKQNPIISSHDEFKDHFTTMRNCKNKIFFNTLTEKLLGKYR